MQKIIWFAMAAILLFTASCKKNVQPKTQLSGTYTGTFLRVSMAYKEPESVKISFTQNRFDGGAAQNKYPDIW